MKRNVIALLIAVVLGGLTFWLITTRQHSTVPKKLRDFAVKDTGSITKIFLADKAGRQVTLTRVKSVEGPGSQWMVDGKYVARPDAIKTLLVTIHDVSVRKPVGLKAQDAIIKQLATGSTKCEIYAGDKLIKQYYVGNETPDMMGTFMLLSDVSDPDDIVNSTEPFETEIKGFNGYLTPRYFTSVTEWRERTVFHYFVPDIRSIRVENYLDSNGTFTITQATGSKEFALQDESGNKLPFEEGIIKQYISYFGRINFENFETSQHLRDSVTATKPVFKITVTDASNKKNEVWMYLKKNDGKMPVDSSAAAPPPYDPDRMYALVNDKTDFVIVQYYVFGKLLPTTDYFAPRKSSKGKSGPK
jgi:hypothetical protein